MVVGVNRFNCFPWLMWSINARLWQYMVYLSPRNFTNNNVWNETMASSLLRILWSMLNEVCWMKEATSSERSLKWNLWSEFGVKTCHCLWYSHMLTDVATLTTKGHSSLRSSANSCHDPKPIIWDLTIKSLGKLIIGRTLEVWQLTK